MKKITIKDIAAKAGVSKTAISFAFNSPEKLPPRTVERILTLAMEMGYSPDPLARSMSTKKTGSIGLLIPQSIQNIVLNPFFSELLEGIGESCEITGQSLLLIPPIKGSISRAISSAVVDGFLTLGLENDYEGLKVLHQRQIPFIMIDSDPLENVPCININDSKGAYQAMKHLLDLGHRSIAVISFLNPQGDYKNYKGVISRRINSYIEALNEYGLTLDSPSIDLYECAVSSEAGEKIFRQIWSKKEHPTAIISMSDTVALGIMEAAQNIGISIPENLSIVGFDDIPEASHIVPGLTTVSQPTRQKGRLASELLNRLLKQENIQKHHLLNTQLVVRDSTARPKLS